MAQTLERLEDQDAITRLLFAYCEGIDSGDFNQTARLFNRGTWFLNPETPCAGFEAVSSFLHDSVILYGTVRETRHTVSNIRIDIDSQRSRATCRSTVIVFQSVPGQAPHIMFQGAYDDVFSRTGGEWHFHERRIETDGTGDMSLHLKTAHAV